MIKNCRCILVFVWTSICLLSWSATGVEVFVTQATGYTSHCCRLWLRNWMVRVIGCEKLYLALMILGHSRDLLSLSLNSSFFLWILVSGRSFCGRKDCKFGCIWGLFLGRSFVKKGILADSWEILRRTQVERKVFAVPLLFIESFWGNVNLLKSTSLRKAVISPLPFLLK